MYKEYLVRITLVTDAQAFNPEKTTSYKPL